MNKELLKKTPIVILLAMVCCFLWGCAFPCIKIGYKLFDIKAGATSSQILFAGIRFTLAGIMVIAITSIKDKKFLKPCNYGQIIKLSVFQTVAQYVFFYIGLAHTTGVKSSVLNGTGVFFTILVSCLVFKQEKLTGKKILGSILGFAGVVIVNLVGSDIDFHMSFLGEGFILLSGLSFAFSSGFIKKYSKQTNVVMLSAYQFFTGGLVMILVGLVFGGRINQVSVGGLGVLLYLAFISAAAYTIWGILLKYNDVSKVSAYKFMNPIFGVVMSFALLRENSQMGIQTIIALLLVCLGIYVVNMTDKKRKI